MIPTVDNKFEKFDIDDFNKNSIRGSLLISRKDITILKDRQSYGFIKQTYKNDIFCINHIYYKSGNIREKGIEFNEGSPIGIWYYYDESGKLIKEEDTDIGYDFGPMEVVKYCEENKIVLPKGYQPTGYQTRVLKQEFEGKKVWRISYQIAGDKIQQILLDGKTGKELQKKIVPFYNP
ncbi:hypothetical protein [Bergeyella zoohelcum]|nr:hypothetical protein [Bergeyella zoohelcum]